MKFFLKGLWIILLQASLEQKAQAAPAIPIRLAQSDISETVGVIKLYKGGTNLYHQKKYREALTIFTKILKNYPEHELSLIHAAKSHYQLDRYDDAFKVFSKVNLKSLNEDTSYEYGYTFFLKKKWSEAWQAFNRVPKGHPQFDLASYHSGYCAYKLNKYPQAIQLLDQAVVLPSKTMRQKTKIRRLAVKKMTKKTSPPPQAAPTVATPPQTLDTGFFTMEPSAALNLALEQQEHEISGGSKISSSHTQSSFLGVYGRRIVDFLGTNLLVGMRVKGGQISQTETSIPLGKSFASEYEMSLGNRFDPTSLGVIDARLIPEWQLGNTTWLSAGIGYQYFTISSESALASTVPYVFAQISNKSPKHVSFAKVSLFQLTEDSIDILQRIDGELSTDRPLTENISAKLESQLSQIIYNSDDSDGADWFTRLKGKLVYKVNAPITIGLYAHYEKVNGIQIHNLNGIPLLAYNNDITGGGVEIEATPFPWLKTTLAGQQFTQASDSIIPDNEASKSSLAAIFPTKVTSLIATIIVQHQF